MAAENKCPRTLGQSFEALEEMLGDIKDTLDSIVERMDEAEEQRAYGAPEDYVEPADFDEYGSLQ